MSTAAHRVRFRPAPKVGAGWVFWAALIPTLAAIVGFGGVYSYIWAPTDIALFIALAVLFWKRLPSGRSLPYHPLLWPMLGFGLVVLAQWALRLSVYPGATLTQLVTLAGCGVVFYLSFCSARRRGTIPLLGRILWCFCGLLAAEAILQAFGAGNYIYWFHDATYATPVGPFVYHNFYAGCMDLLLPVSVVYVSLPSRDKNPRWVTWIGRGLIPALALASLAVSRSRGGVIVVACEIILGFAVFWPYLKRHKRTRGAALLGMAALLAFGLLGNWGPISRRFAKLEAHDASATERITLGATCWRIFLAHPAWGTGFATFATVYPRFQSFDSGLIVPYAHNDYAQTLAETGVAGAACVLVFLGIWTWEFWRRRQRREFGDPAARLQLGCFIGMAGFLLHSYGDFQFQAPGNAMLFFLLAGAALAQPRAARQAEGDSVDIAGRERRVLKV